MALPNASTLSHKGGPSKLCLGGALPCYHSRMAKTKKFDLDKPAPVVDDEDEEALAAIDEGMRDADAGRTVPAEEVRRLLPKWTTASSTRNRI